MLEQKLAQSEEKIQQLEGIEKKLAKAEEKNQELQQGLESPEKFLLVKRDLSTLLLSLLDRAKWRLLKNLSKTIRKK